MTRGLRGVLTGEDSDGLDLRGCEVGGAVRLPDWPGRRQEAARECWDCSGRFHAAGVQTLLSSLWSVSDAATVELMEEFYSRLWGKEKVSRLEALRQAQLAVLRDPQTGANRAAKRCWPTRRNAACRRMCFAA